VFVALTVVAVNLLHLSVPVALLASAPSRSCGIAQ